ncbi:stage V sporulation protein AD [Erysipelatoclostridium ramosum]|uniref:stage V sporulation protein AD n=1 Tax=Thomasclavelia ramosa TaxID=1547 RepID=UPI00192B35B0|nr:stage V sporulation protein AD [Thomasclavelia ramosa]MCR1946310.1 stage V sporulation protein AD [Thomasclavelia ramosa]QQY26451.1 stage V sporulation protein AD [Thomasclavelia ramosa]
MSSVLSGSSMQLNNVYVRATGTTCGIDEFNGPLGQYFDRHYPDFHFGHKSYELAEMAMLQDATSHALKKGKLKKDDINVFLGGDLNNQVTASNYTAKDFQRPFMAMYGACATMGLVINTASMLIENHCIHNANCFVCSHNATAERQFRYPIEYGVQRKETMTTTATGAVSVILDNNPSAVRIEALTIGRVIDMNQSDPNDMGRAMAPAAFDTLVNHLKDLNRQGTDYDLILTGDLSTYGKSIMKELMNENSVTYNEYDDCGCLLYDSDQDVNQGGSGPSCSALVAFGYIYQKMLKHKYKRVLVITTGALLSPVMTNQKQSIPCIAHAFSLEVVE